jgi:hypothetical protein
MYKMLETHINASRDTFVLNLMHRIQTHDNLF